MIKKKHPSPTKENDQKKVMINNKKMTIKRRRQSLIKNDNHQLKRTVRRRCPSPIKNQKEINTNRKDE
jgi:hypothetical protein